jgi:hypothetical protein
MEHVAVVLWDGAPRKWPVVDGVVRRCVAGMLAAMPPGGRARVVHAPTLAEAFAPPGGAPPDGAGPGGARPDNVKMLIISPFFLAPASRAAEVEAARRVWPGLRGRPTGGDSDWLVEGPQCRMNGGPGCGCQICQASAPTIITSATALGIPPQ